METALIQSYLNSNNLRWAPSTLKSERARLNALPKSWHLKEPKSIYQALVDANRAPYSIKTSFIRMSAAYSWAYPNKLNPFRAFLRSHANLFKYAYQKKSLKISFEQARKVIAQLPVAEQLKARQLLASGMRY